MKNIDFKKLLVLIVIIAVAVLLIFGTTKLFKGIGKPSEKVQKEIAERITNYYARSYIGYSTVYGGVDLLYDEDKVEVKDLYEGSMIELAIKYAIKNNKDIKGDEQASKDLQNLLKIEGTSYDADKIIAIVKDLFDVELKKETISGNSSYIYDYYYVEKYNSFVKAKSSVYDLTTPESLMNFYVISTKKNKDTFESKVAVAYVYQSNNKFVYAKDKNGTKIVAQDLSENEFPKDKVEEFTTYKFTTKKVGDNYILVSIEKDK